MKLPKGKGEMMKEYTKQDIKKRIANTFGFAMNKIVLLEWMTTFDKALIALTLLLFFSLPFSSWFIW